jgi:TetR/AcrR family transcriptional regulator, mexJK operon transcriptional repressor
MILPGPKQLLGEDRQSRIVIAALVVFSKSSFGDATTEEIARHAHVSKRDIYAAFPDKHAILTAAVNMVLQAGDENLRRVISDSQRALSSHKETLEIIGLTLVGEILSPSSGFVFRLVSSESVEEPALGATYFENWYTRRSRTIAQFCSRYLVKGNGRTGRRCDTNLAAKQFVGLVTHLPQLTASIGMLDMWNTKSIQAHVRTAVECFLSAYPCLA